MGCDAEWPATPAETGGWRVHNKDGSDARTFATFAGAVAEFHRRRADWQREAKALQDRMPTLDPVGSTGAEGG